MRMEDEYVEVADELLARDALALLITLVTRQIQQLTDCLRDEHPFPRRSIQALETARREIVTYRASLDCPRLIRPITTNTTDQHQTLWESDDNNDV